MWPTGPLLVHVFCALLLAGETQAQSVSNCGGAADHLSNVKIDLSPDPIKRDTPFTIIVAGSMDEDLTHGTVIVDLEVRALGVIDDKIHKSVGFTFSPALISKGDVRFQIGPLTLPRGLPGKLVLKGTVHITNDKNEPVACVGLNFDVPLLGQNLLTETAPITTCTKPADHMKDFNVTSDGSGVTMVSGTLDEDVTSFSALVDVKFLMLFGPHLKLTVPFVFQPGFKKGDQKCTFTDGKSLNSALPAVKVKGTVSVDDGAGEEIVCFNLGSSSTAVQRESAAASALIV